MRPAATSCSSGFHTWVWARSTSVIAALPERPSLSPSAVASGKPPAPPPTMTIRCGVAAAGCSVTAHRPFATRIGAAVPAPAGAYDHLQAAVLLDDLRRFPQRLELGCKRLRPGAALELGRAVAAADVRQIDGGLRIEPAVQYRDQCLGDVIDDGGTAGRADDDGDPSFRIVDDRRRHRRARPLAALDPVRDLAAAVGRDETEIGQLVVEQKSASGHQLAAKRIF